MNTANGKLISTIANLENKTKELHHTIGKMAYDQANLYKMMWLLINASGGQIRIDEISMVTFDPAKAAIDTFYDEVNHQYVCTAIRDKTKTASHSTDQG